MNVAKRFVFLFFAVFLVLALGSPPKAMAHYDYKLIPGMPFPYFEIEDLNRQRWVSTYLRGRPVVIITGHRYQRYEMLKWVEMLRRDFWGAGQIHLLWVVNTSKFPWTTSRSTVATEWRKFSPPVPLLLDWHGVVGHNLRVNYGVPNIIAIDAVGRLAFHEMHTFSPGAYSSVAQRIAGLITATPGMVKPAAMTPADGNFDDRRMAYGGLGRGKKGDSE